MSPRDDSSATPAASTLDARRHAVATNRFVRALERFAATAYIRAIRDGVIATLPITLIGSVFLLVARPPHDGLAAAVAPYADALLVPTKLLTGAIALYLCFAVAYALARAYELEPVGSALIAVAGFLVAAGPAPLAAGAWGLDSRALGPGGVAGAI